MRVQEEMDRRANMVSGKGNKCGGREEWTNQAKGIRRVFRQSRIRNRKIRLRLG